MTGDSAKYILHFRIIQANFIYFRIIQANFIQANFNIKLSVGDVHAHSDSVLRGYY